MKKKFRILLTAVLLCSIIGFSTVGAQEIETKGPTFTSKNLRQVKNIGGTNVTVQITVDSLMNAFETIVTYRNNSAKVVSPSSFKLRKVYHEETPGMSYIFVVNVTVYNPTSGKEGVIVFKVDKDGNLIY